MKHELLEVANLPTMPAPMQSSDAGEAWVWGDFFATLQKNPMLVSQGIQAMLGQPVTKTPPMAYPYAMMVFYNKARNPHGPSSRPVLCVGLEQADYGALAALLGGEAVNLQQVQGAKGPLMIGMFYGAGRVNFGEFDGFVTADTARECFFKIIRSQLGLTGDPVRIGTIKDVYGHPGTGWPADSGFPTLKKRGCTAVIASLAVIMVLAWGTWELAALFAKP